MGRLALDILVIAALSKEMLQHSSLIPVELFIIAILGIPFFLGMGSQQTEKSGAVTSPVGAVVRNGVAVVSLIMFACLQLLSGTLWTYGAVLGLSLIIYFVGRSFGMLYKGFLFIILVFIVVYVVNRLG